MSGLRVAYGVAMRLAAPMLRIGLRVRARRGKEVSDRLGERRGIASAPCPPGVLVWLHAASVGETVSVLPVLVEIVRRDPAAQVLLTSGTVTSERLLARRITELGLQLHVRHQFLPLDVPNWVARFLDHWRPRVAGFVESELWPNLLAGCRARAVPLVLINARLSARSFARWRRLPGVARDMLEAVHGVRAQSAADAARFVALGARDVCAPGNLKFAAPALPVDAAELERWRGALAGRKVWLAASVHPDEVAVIGDAHAALAAAHPGLLTIIVPRHPERGAEFAARLGGVAVTRRGAGEGPPAGVGVWIADTLGELGLFYRLAPVVVMGRSLAAPGGGQNPLEAARLGCAVAAGPLMENFTEVAATLEAAGALARVADAAGLAAWVDGMLRDPGLMARMGQAGRVACDRLDTLPGEIAAELLALAAPEGLG